MRGLNNLFLKASIIMDITNEIFSYPYWIQNSDRLKYSADILIERLPVLMNSSEEKDDYKNYTCKVRSILETNLLLLGYSIENLLKGLLIYQFKKNNAFLENVSFDFLIKTVWRVKNSHDLLKLARSAKISLSENEKSLLEKLSKYSTWGGRYHIPKDSEGIDKVKRPGEGDRHSSSDQKIAKELTLRIKALITNEQ